MIFTPILAAKFLKRHDGMNCDFNMLCDLDDRAQDALVARALRHDDGVAAQEHSRPGRPIYYCEEDFDKEEHRA
jgi:hypothetical protein